MPTKLPFNFPSKIFQPVKARIPVRGMVRAMGEVPLDDKTSQVYQGVENYRQAKAKLNSARNTYQMQILSLQSQLDGLNNALDYADSAFQEQIASVVPGGQKLSLDEFKKSYPELYPESIYNLDQENASIQSQVTQLKSQIADFKRGIDYLNSAGDELDKAYLALQADYPEFATPSTDQVNAQLEDDGMIPQVDQQEPFIDPASYAAIPQGEETNQMALTQAPEAQVGSSEKKSLMPYAIAAGIVFLLF